MGLGVLLLLLLLLLFGVVWAASESHSLGRIFGTDWRVT